MSVVLRLRTTHIFSSSHFYYLIYSLVARKLMSLLYPGFPIAGASDPPCLYFTSFKFVGLHLDEFISLQHVISKLASSNYAIGRSRNFLPLNIRKTLYNSLFRSHAEFGILAWGCSPASKLKKIISLQKKCGKCWLQIPHRSNFS